MPLPSSIVDETLLIVEGREDVIFFEALVRSMGTKTVKIEDIGGKTRLPDNLKALQTRSGFDRLTTIGIVRDADNDPDAAFRSVCGALGNNGFAVPRKPLQFAGNNPRVIILLLPAGNDKTPGMLEDVCLSAVNEEPNMACVNEFFTCLQQRDIPLPSGISKAKIQVYLASREPELRLGLAAEKGFLDWNHVAFDPLKQFLNLIISSEGS